MRDFTMKMIKNVIGLILVGVGIIVVAADEISISTQHKELYYTKQPQIKSSVQ